MRSKPCLVTILTNKMPPPLGANQMVALAVDFSEPLQKPVPTCFFTLPKYAFLATLVQLCFYRFCCLANKTLKEEQACRNCMTLHVDTFVRAATFYGSYCLIFSSVRFSLLPPFLTLQKSFKHLQRPPIIKSKIGRLRLCNSFCPWALTDDDKCR